ncbi:MAG: thioredoxin family protein [Saprospiraceae bacterium]|nr:thioredoxin family protein [Bacteroidia bacterium]NNL93099.1 thioredoxin family protein [Saprospiraceae bacterium]
MALTESNMLPLGTTAPSFTLHDTVSKRSLSFIDIKGTKGTVVVFSCNHCPFVVHINQELVNLANQYIPQGFGFVAISSNDVANYPDDSPEKMSLVAKVLKYPFPYLYDETQDVAKAYDAACTPDFYIFNKEDKLVYRGRLDASRPGNSLPVTGADIRFALDAIALGINDISPQIPSAGCNIKWK